MNVALRSSARTMMSLASRAAASVCGSCRFAFTSAALKPAVSRPSAQEPRCRCARTVSTSSAVSTAVMGTSMDLQTHVDRQGATAAGAGYHVILRGAGVVGRRVVVAVEQVQAIQLQRDISGELVRHHRIPDHIAGKACGLAAVCEALS